MTLTTLPEAAPLPVYHVEVRFGAAIPGPDQGRALLALERYLRETLGVPAEVYKEARPDDLKRAAAVRC